MSTTTDLKDFGFREIKIAASLLNAYCEQSTDWLGDGVQLMMNRNSGYVFLTDEDCSVAMMNGESLDAWLFTPHDGHEGFLEELVEQFAPADLDNDDVDYIRHWVEVLSFSLPENWTPKEND